jgi:hypothetical protein
MPLYAAGRRNYDELVERNLSTGDDPRRRRQGDRRGDHRPKPETEAYRRRDRADNQCGASRRPPADFRPHHPQVQSYAELIAAGCTNESQRIRRVSAG